MARALFFESWPPWAQYGRSRDSVQFSGFSTWSLARSVRGVKKFGTRESCKPMVRETAPEKRFWVSGALNDQTGRCRTAVLARRLASALFSRGTWEMEKLRARASLRQVQCRE